MQYLRARKITTNEPTDLRVRFWVAGVDSRSSRKCLWGIRWSIDIYCPELPKNGSNHSQLESISIFPWMHLFNMPLFILIRMSTYNTCLCVCLQARIYANSQPKKDRYSLVDVKSCVKSRILQGEESLKFVSHSASLTRLCLIGVLAVYPVPPSPLSLAFFTERTTDIY